MADSKAITDAQRLFRGSCDFIFGTARADQLPDADRPEIAFAGRSNVGKSTLVNALTGRKALARTSHTPGRTQQLNFFNLADFLYLVDMPGYGYAKVSDTQRESWEALIRDYLRGRPNLRCVFVLIDSRRGMVESDGEFLKMLGQAAVSARIVMTKADELKKKELEAAVADVRAALAKYPSAFPEPVVTSSHDETGIDDLRDVILNVAE